VLLLPRGSLWRSLLLLHLTLITLITIAFVAYPFAPPFCLPAGKRARTSGSTARPVVATRQHATRMSSAAAAGNAGMGRQYQTAHAAAALHSALAQAAGAAIARGKGAQQQQQQQQQGFFPLLQPGVVKASDGGTPLMLPLLLQQGSGSAPPPLPLPLPRDSSEGAAGDDASGSGGMKLSHYTPVASLLKDPLPGLTLPSPAAGGADAFSFHPSLAASLDGSSSGHSTPRASAAAAAAAAARRTLPLRWIHRRWLRPQP
jgi:hypothetical protein